MKVVDSWNRPPVNGRTECESPNSGLPIKGLRSHVRMWIRCRNAELVTCVWGFGGEAPVVPTSCVWSVLLSVPVTKREVPSSWASMVKRRLEVGKVPRCWRPSQGCVTDTVQSKCCLSEVTFQCSSARVPPSEAVHKLRLLTQVKTRFYRVCITNTNQLVLKKYIFAWRQRFAHEDMWL